MTPVTTAGAVAFLIQSLALGPTAYADAPPAQAKRPYIVVTDGISLAPGPMEDFTVGVGAEGVQVDLYQDYRDMASGKLLENHTLAPALLRGLHGKRLSISGLITYAVLVRNKTRQVTESDNEIRDILTLEVHREL